MTSIHIRNLKQCQISDTIIPFHSVSSGVDPLYGAVSANHDFLYVPGMVIV